VQEPSETAIDDDFASKMGLENLEALRDAIRPQLEQENNNLSRARLKRALLDKLEEGHDFPVPEGMVNSEFDAIWNQIEEQRKNAGVTDDEDSGKSDDELKEEYRAIAQRRVRLGLVLAEVGRANNIEVQQDELQRAIIEQARNYPGQERQVMEFYEKNPQMVDQLRAPIFEDKVVDFIVEMAKVTEKPVTREELMKDPDEEAAEKPKKKAKSSKSGAKKTAAKSTKSKAKADSTDKDA
jgi:trigger factor